VSLVVFPLSRLRKARVLGVYKQLGCWRCTGLMYCCQQRGRVLDRPRELEISLRRALIVERQRRLRGFKIANTPP
jgi:hypothetical protein